MTATPLCANAKCQQPMPNWLGAINLRPTSYRRIVCRKCFGKSFTDKLDQPDQPRALIELDQHLLWLIKTKNDRLRSVACLAIQLSIPAADEQGVFSDPAGILKTAAQALNLAPEDNYHLIQSARQALVKKGIWQPQGIQLKGRNNQQNQMRLREDLRHLPAPP